MSSTDVFALLTGLTGDEVYCETCDVRLRQGQLDQHLRGRKHAYSKKRRERQRERHEDNRERKRLAKPLREGIRKKLLQTCFDAMKSSGTSTRDVALMSRL